MTGALSLAITSSTGVIGLALGTVALDGKAGAATQGTVEGTVADVIAIEIATERRHAEEISPRLAEIMAESGRRLSDLDRLVVDVGPGRFTGLRVGMATVRALAFALNVPVIGLSSLEILAAGQTAPTVTAVLDARRNEVFQQTFSGGQALGDPEVGDPEVLMASAEGLVVGDGLDRYLELYQDLEHAKAQNPKAAIMLALSAGRQGQLGSTVEPLYLRDPDANPNVKTRRDGAPPSTDVPVVGS